VEEEHHKTAVFRIASLQVKI